MSKTNKNKKSVKAVTDCWNTIGVWSRGDNKCEKLSEHIHCRNCPVFSEIGHSVFEKAAPSGYLTQWRKAIAGQEKVDDSKTNSILVFRVGNEWFALPAEILSEVSNERSVHRIPRNMNRFISGVVNINGEIKVCYSFSDLLELNVINEKVEKSDVYQPRRLIVIELSELHYVFLVDEVKGLHWYADSDLLPVPATLNAENALLLLGAVKQFDHQIAVFNINEFQKKLEGSAS